MTHSHAYSMIYQHWHPLFIDKLKRRLSDELDSCRLYLFLHESHNCVSFHILKIIQSIYETVICLMETFQHRCNYQRTW